MSDYPNIKRNDLFNLIQRVGLIDKKNVSSFTMNIMFSSVNFDATKNFEENPTKEIVRYEFTEMITRIAHKLYPTLHLPLALRRVIDDHLLPVYCKDFKDFFEFRKHLYTLEVDNLYSANLDHIKRVIKKYSELGKKDAWD